MKKPANIIAGEARRGLKPRPQASRRKALAQHFLVDRNVLECILSEADVGHQDTVVEVGSGHGAVTRQLVSRADRVIAIEMDPRLAASLSASLGNPSNLKVINADAREVDLAQILEVEGPYKLVANLPYYAANPILRRFLEAGRHRPTLAVVMVQKEVANRMASEGGRMSLLAVGIQLYGIPRVVCLVPPRAFAPPPKVTSALVRIDLRPHPAIEVDDVDRFFDVVRAGFSAPRKQLLNSLSLGLGISTDRAGHLLGVAGLDPRRRAENLSLEEWGKLYHQACKNCHAMRSEASEL